jgi:hypothetical protein
LARGSRPSHTLLLKGLRKGAELLALKGLLVEGLAQSASANAPSLHLTRTNTFSGHAFSGHTFRGEDTARGNLVRPNRTRHTDLRHTSGIGSSGTSDQTLHTRLKLRADALTGHSSLPACHCVLLGCAQSPLGLFLGVAINGPTGGCEGVNRHPFGSLHRKPTHLI